MEYLVRASALEGFSEQVLELGGTPEALFRAVNIDPEVLAEPENLIAYRTFLELLNLAAEHTANEHFGLLLSRKQSVRMYGALGLLLRESADVRSALKGFIRFFHLYNQGATVELQEDGRFAILKFTIHQPGTYCCRQQEDLALGLGVNLMRLLCGENWTPVNECFMHTAPRDMRLYHQRFRCPLRFDQESTSTVFDTGVLDQKIASSDEQRHSILLEHLGRQLLHSPNDFGQNMKQLITKAMFAGDCSIERVADFLAINKRTLQRQLKQQGLSYKALLEEVRIDTASRYLRESSMPLTQIADILCYNDLSAFSNAFKRRCQMSPRQWRETHCSKFRPVGLLA